MHVELWAEFWVRGLLLSDSVPVRLALLHVGVHGIEGADTPATKGADKAPPRLRQATSLWGGVGAWGNVQGVGGCLQRGGVRSC